MFCCFIVVTRYRGAGAKFVRYYFVLHVLRVTGNRKRTQNVRILFREIDT